MDSISFIQIISTCVGRDTQSVDLMYALPYLTHEQLTTHAVKNGKQTFFKKINEPMDRQTCE